MDESQLLHRIVSDPWLERDDVLACLAYAKRLVAQATGPDKPPDSVVRGGSRLRGRGG
jgi:hypothetical protein